MLSRRDFSLLTPSLAVGLPALAAAAKINSTYKDVKFGAQSYSFRDRDLDGAIQAMKEVGLGSVELFSGHAEPKQERGPEGRAAIRKWRETVDLQHFRDIRKKLDDAGIELWAFNYSFRDDFSDKEMERGFEFAKALRVTRLTASSNISTVKRIDPLAAKHGITVGMHNHSNIRANEFATAENFAEAMKGASKYIGINLDIGHFWAAGFNPVQYLEEHAKHVVCIHVKDRKKDQGPNVPFGEGDTPIKATLELMSKKKYKFPANIEYEYKGADTVVEVKKCLEYCKKQLG